MTNEEFLNKVSSLPYGSEYQFFDLYINANTKLRVKHLTCGHEYSVSPHNFLQGRQCPVCANIRRSISNMKNPDEKKVKDKAVEKKITVDQPKKKQYISPTVEFCDYDITKTGTHLFDLDGKGLHFVTTQNKPEDVIDIRTTFTKEHPMPKFIPTKPTFSEFMDECSTKVTVQKNVMCGNTKLQYYFPDQKVAFNYYTMTEASETIGGKKRGWMQNDYNAALEKDIHLIQILEEEWEERKEVLKSKLLHQLNLIPTKIIYTRKCVVKEISSEEKEKFCKKFHIQGGDTSKIKLGLFYGDELVAVQTYVPPRLCMGVKQDKVNTGEYELLRFCVNTNYTITGAFGKLQKYFIQHYHPTKITTFADLRWTDQRSNIYLKNHYTYSHSTQANYWYFCYGKGEITKRHRFNFRKQEVLKKFTPNCSEKLTEYENCLRNGYDRIFDAGNDLYILDVNKLGALCQNN